MKNIQIMLYFRLKGIPGCHFHDLVPLFVVFDFLSLTIILKSKLNSSSDNTSNEDAFVVGEVVCTEVES